MKILIIFLFISNCMGCTAYDLWKLENKIGSKTQEIEAKMLIARILGSHFHFSSRHHHS